MTSIAHPQEWKDWLFHIQQNLITSGYVHSLTETGMQDHTAYFSGLYQFFTELQEKPKKQ